MYKVSVSKVITEDMSDLLAMRYDKADTLRIYLNLHRYFQLLVLAMTCCAVLAILVTPSAGQHVYLGYPYTYGYAYPYTGYGSYGYYPYGAYGYYGTHVRLLKK